MAASCHGSTRQTSVTRRRAEASALRPYTQTRAVSRKTTHEHSQRRLQHIQLGTDSLRIPSIARAPALVFALFLSPQLLHTGRQHSRTKTWPLRSKSTVTSRRSTSSPSQRMTSFKSYASLPCQERKVGSSEEGRLLTFPARPHLGRGQHCHVPELLPRPRTRRPAPSARRPRPTPRPPLRARPRLARYGLHQSSPGRTVCGSTRRQLGRHRRVAQTGRAGGEPETEGGPRRRVPRRRAQLGPRRHGRVRKDLDRVGRHARQVDGRKGSLVYVPFPSFLPFCPARENPSCLFFLFPPDARKTDHIPTCPTDLCPIWVKDEYQGFGFGRLLLEDILNRCDQQTPPTPVYLEATPTGKGLYKKLGFVEVGTSEYVEMVRWHKDGRAEP